MPSLREILCLSTSGFHPHSVDWHRVHTPLGYIPAAAVNAYGVVELARSAMGIGDHGLLAISTAYGIATMALPLLDDGRCG